MTVAARTQGFTWTNLSRFDVSRVGFLLCFVLGFAVRLIPEVLSYPYPIGFDTVYYAARIKSEVVWGHWSEVFSTWLLYAVLVPMYKVVGGDPFLLLKLVAPTLYALDVCGIYYFARKALEWDSKKSLVAGFFFTFLLAALRISWDLYRNTLGMAVLLFTLPWVRDLETKRNFVLFVLLSVLVVFSHEYASVIMFAVVLGLTITGLLRGERRRVFKALVAMLPVSALFLTRIYLTLFPVPYHVETNVIGASLPLMRPGGLFFLVNYLNASTYLNLVSHVFSLFGVLYLVWLPLVFVGFFRDRILDSWTLLLLVGSFSSLLTPFCALDLWNRWMFMLVYPFTFYATQGVGKILGPQSKIFKFVLRRENISKGVMLGILVSTVLLGLLFMVMPVDHGFFSSGNINSYFPSTMLHNTVPLQDVRGVIECINWLNENMVDGSCVLMHGALMSWARLYLGKAHSIVYFLGNVERALNVASEHEFDPVYLVWWSEDIGWHGFSVPESFIPVFSSGRFSVFKHYSSS